MRSIQYKDLPLSEQFKLIKSEYTKVERSIMIRHASGRRISPYWMDWSFTPIEFNVWCDIRCAGIPFYPQIPVLNYFIDFGDPYKKIGIEVDGKEFHLDKEKDRQRDLKLNKEGWRIIRIPGNKTFKSKDNFRTIGEYLTNSSEGIILKLKKSAYSSSEVAEMKDEYYFSDDLSEVEDYND